MWTDHGPSEFLWGNFESVGITWDDLGLFGITIDRSSCGPHGDMLRKTPCVWEPGMAGIIET